MVANKEVNLLYEGFEQAYSRLCSSYKLSDDAKVFIPLFETLNWSVTLQDKIADICGRAWYMAYPSGSLVLGIRYARNTVHHDWTKALYKENGAIFPVVMPMVLFEWFWVAENHLPSPPKGKDKGRIEYINFLEKQSAKQTLSTLNVIFQQVVK